MEKVTGIARDRLLPTFSPGAVLEVVPQPRHRATRAPARRSIAARSRCSRRVSSSTRSRRSARRAVAVLEHNGFTCELPEGPGVLRHAVARRGRHRQVPRSTRRRNVDALLPAVEAGRSIVVPQPTCAYTLKDEYPAFLGTDAARKVAASDLRRVGVPDERAQARRSSTRTSTGRRTSRSSGTPRATTAPSRSARGARSSCS